MQQVDIDYIMTKKDKTAENVVFRGFIYFFL